MASQQVITAHVLVEFSGADEAITAFVEVDDREFGFNQGRTTFFPGQDAYLLLFKPTGFSVVYNEVTSGTIVKVQTATREVQETIQFVNEDSSTVRYPIDANFTYAWVGKSAGVLSSSQFGVSLPARAIDPNSQVTIPEYRIGVADITYTSNCEVWKLSGVPNGVAQVLCFFVVRKD